MSRTPEGATEPVLLFRGRRPARDPCSVPSAAVFDLSLRAAYETTSTARGWLVDGLLAASVPSRRASAVTSTRLASRIPMPIRPSGWQFVQNEDGDDYREGGHGRGGSQAMPRIQRLGVLFATATSGRE